MRLHRSLAALPFPPKMSPEQLRRVERQVQEALARLGPETAGTFLPLDSTAWGTAMAASLQADRVLFDHEAPPPERPNRSVRLPQGNHSLSDFFF